MIFTIADATTAILALAGLAGFVLEWRRESKRDDLAERVTRLEEQLGEMQSWRDRMSRAQ
jgi:hypothetical protein